MKMHFLKLIFLALFGFITIVGSIHIFRQERSISYIASPFHGQNINKPAYDASETQKLREIGYNKMNPVSINPENNNRTNDSAVPKTTKNLCFKQKSNENLSTVKDLKLKCTYKNKIKSRYLDKQKAKERKMRQKEKIKELYLVEDIFAKNNEETNNQFIKSFCQQVLAHLNNLTNRQKEILTNEIYPLQDFKSDGPIADDGKEFYANEHNALNFFTPVCNIKDKNVIKKKIIFFLRIIKFYTKYLETVSKDFDDTKNAMSKRELKKRETEEVNGLN